jgi:hypothetical protein
MVTGRHGVGNKACAVGVRLARLSVAPHTPLPARAGIFKREKV